jgi:glyoxylase-like metal-dependent hydrolase (beta-lactamase superfamily II)
VSALLRETFPVGFLQCNCTILADTAAAEAVVIDPGDDISRIEAYLAKHNLRLKQIIVTHGHIDHVGGAVQLRRATGAPIYMNEKDLPQLAIMEQQAGWFGVETPEVGPPDVDAVQGTRTAAGAWAGEILATPGHTEGSICVYFPQQTLFLAGDTLFAGGIGRTDFPGGNSAAIFRSLQDVVLALPDETTVVPGHGPETIIGVERATNPFLK